MSYHLQVFFTPDPALASRELYRSINQHGPDVWKILTSLPPYIPLLIVSDVRFTVAGQVQLLDDFVHPKTGRRSRCFRVTYRSMDRSLTNEEIDQLQDVVRNCISSRLKAELR